MLVIRFGIRPPLVTGLLFFVAGLLYFARAPVDGNYVVDVLPSMLLLGLGGGISFNPMLLAAMGDVEPTDSGLASGIVNTSQMMGGALGLAVLASLAASRTDHLRAAGDGSLEALVGGYHAAFLVGAALRRRGGRDRRGVLPPGSRPGRRARLRRRGRRRRRRRLSTPAARKQKRRNERCREQPDGDPERRSERGRDRRRDGRPLLLRQRGRPPGCRRRSPAHSPRSHAARRSRGAPCRSRPRRAGSC